MNYKHLALSERIDAVLKYNIPILNDDFEALRKVCKVVWPNRKAYMFYYEKKGGCVSADPHPNYHLAIPASKFFDETDDTPKEGELTDEEISEIAAEHATGSPINSFFLGYKYAREHATQPDMIRIEEGLNQPIREITESEIEGSAFNYVQLESVSQFDEGFEAERNEYLAFKHGAKWAIENLPKTFTVEQFLAAAKKGEVSMIDAKHICGILKETMLNHPR